MNEFTKQTVDYDHWCDECSAMVINKTEHYNWHAIVGKAMEWRDTRLSILQRDIGELYKRVIELEDKMSVMQEENEWLRQQISELNRVDDDVVYLINRVDDLENDAESTQEESDIQKENNLLLQEYNELHAQFDSLSSKYCRLERTLRDLPDRITKECERERAAYDSYMEKDYRQGIHLGGWTARNVALAAIPDDRD